MPEVTAAKPQKFDPFFLEQVKETWTEQKYKLGIDYIDAQHMWLLALIMKLGKFAGKVTGAHEISGFHECLEEVLSYADFHFEAEERLLYDSGYLQTEEHIKQHRSFAASMRKLAERQNITDRDKAQRLYRYLRQWLISHIKKEDHSYKEFFAQRHFNANQYFQEGIAGGDWQLPKEIADFYQSVGIDNEVIPGITSLVLNSVYDAWKKFKLRLGVPVLDIQHAWLIKLVIDLEFALHESVERRRTVLSSTIREVFKYINEHFYTEEKLMEKLAFPELISHRKQHDDFRGTMVNRRAEYENGNHHASTNLVLDLKEWLLSHIAIQDKKFAKICKEQNQLALKASRDLVKAEQVPLRRDQLLLYQYINAREQIEKT